MIEYAKLDFNEQLIENSFFFSEKPIDLSQTKSIDGRPLTREVQRNHVPFDPNKEMEVQDQINITDSLIIITYVTAALPPAQGEEIFQRAQVDAIQVLYETVKALVNNDQTALKIIFQKLDAVVNPPPTK